MGVIGVIKCGVSRTLVGDVIGDVVICFHLVRGLTRVVVGKM